MHEIVTLFARGGGGGSGGGGGGSGGGSGGGGFIVVLGYLPTHFLGLKLRNHRRDAMDLVAMIIGTLLYTTLWLIIGIITKLGFLYFVAIGALLGGPAGYFGWWSKTARFVKQAATAKATMKGISQTDAAWDEPTLTKHVSDVYFRYQQDWSNFNLSNMKNYMTAGNLEYNRLMMLAIQQRQRRNNMQNVQLLSAEPVTVEDAAGADQDAVVYAITGQADDQLLDTSDGKLLFRDKNSFQEYWQFRREGNNWLLDRIDEFTANPLSQDLLAVELAKANNYFYSLDWGWLLLPQRGRIFSDAKFGSSDINNHVIGIYHDVLIELYSYIPRPNNNNHATVYTIAQAALPKRYDSLIVQAKNHGGLFQRPPKGYNQLHMEWPDFNQRYEVYATNVEQVTAFELLHPVYMEKLFDLAFKVSIEVVDNIVYLYSTDKNADYQTMLSLLRDAFQEMKL